MVVLVGAVGALSACGKQPWGDAGPTASAPATSPPTTPELAPDSVVLPELRGAEGYQTALEYRTYLSPPRPCERATSPSDAGLRRYRPAHGMVDDNKRPDVVMEYVARYTDGSGGAAVYLAELRADIKACPGKIRGGTLEGRDGHEWSIMESGFAGDDSLLVRLRGWGKGYQDVCCHDFYLVAVREGQILVTVTALGWEGGGSSGRFAKATAARALEFARTI
jgi:hypothetical protein